MGFFEQHKALIITSLLFAILLLSMYNINISNSNKKVRETLIELNNFRQEEAPKEVEEPKEEVEPPPPSPRTNLQTHQAFNQDRQESRSNVESRLDEIFKKNSALQTSSEAENTESSPGEYNVGPATANKVQRASEGNQSSQETSTRQGSFRNSSIAFSLVGRNAIDIPNPVYTCDTSGKIVVNIVVNAEGAVTNTSINKGSSTSTNECLVERALQYARGAVFSRLAGRNSQPGTITYYFQG